MGACRILFSCKYWFKLVDLTKGLLETSSDMLNQLQNTGPAAKIYKSLSSLSELLFFLSSLPELDESEESEDVALGFRLGAGLSLSSSLDERSTRGTSA